MDNRGIFKEWKMLEGWSESLIMETAGSKICVEVIGLERADTTRVEFECEFGGGGAREWEESVDWAAGIDEPRDKVYSICKCSISN
jgi:hypothetical protein